MKADETAPPVRRWGKFVLRVLASLAVLGVVCFFIDFEKAKEGMRRLSVGTWLATLAAFFVLHALSALKWRHFVSAAGTRIPVGVTLRCHAAGLFGNLCLPSLIGGDVVRAGLAMKSASSRAGLVVASVVDRVADMTALLVLSLTALTFVSAKEATPLRALPVVAAAIAAAGVFGVLTLRWLVRSLVVRRLPGKLPKVVLRIAKALRTMRRRPLHSFTGWLASVAIQSGFVLVNAWFGRTMGLELTYPQWFLLWPLAKIVAMAPISFGGLGVREAAWAALVSPFGAKGISDVAVGQSLVWQSILIVGGLLAGAYWTLSSRMALPRTAKA